ncbi:hypothetical protein B0675_26750 [Streptomyces sp. M41(2017)]|nr:hypothetical protein B0675_26750 [Streptomyces sp. M41(2017)]
MFVMSWGAGNIAQASSQFHDIETAAELLCASVKRAVWYGAAQGEKPAFQRAAEELADAMRCTGQAAIAAGRDWRGESGPAWVALFSRGDR